MEIRGVSCAGAANRLLGWLERDGVRGLSGWVCWRGVAGVRTDAGVGKDDVAAAGGAGEQDTLECLGAQDAAMQAGEDDRQIDGARWRGSWAPWRGA